MTQAPETLTNNIRRPEVHCTVVANIADANSLRDDWLRLLQRAERSELMQSPDWLLNWWRVYGGDGGRQLRIALFHEGERLVGMAPLLLRRHWHGGVLPFRRLELLGSGETAEHGIYSNHLAIIAERGSEHRIAVRFVEALNAGVFGAWDEIVLPMMAGDSAMPSMLVEAMLNAGFHADMTTTALARYIPLPSSWDDYLKTLSKNRRKKLRQSLNDFDAWSDGTTELEAVTCANLERGRQILIDLHHARWAGAGVFRSPYFLDFHQALMRDLAARGDLELLILRARGEPIAAVYNFSWANKVYTYQSGRRVDLPEHLSPGTVLDTMAIRRAIEQGRREFDLLADDIEYKKALTPEARPLVRLRAARPSFLEAIRRLCQSGQRWLSRGRRSMPNPEPLSQIASEPLPTSPLLSASPTTSTKPVSCAD